MTRLNKITYSTLMAYMMAVSFGDVVHAAETSDKLIIYAGPQSAVPLQTIYVTVEAVDGQGRSLDDYPVTLTYNADGAIKYMTAKTANGLVSFDVPAQIKSGLMTFSAHHETDNAQVARVVITADQPVRFLLDTKTSKQPGMIDISSTRLTDRFGNQLLDLSVAMIDWIDESGLIASQTVQISDGRVTLKAVCPKVFSAPLHIRATLKNIYVTSNDVAALCASGQG